MEDCNFAKSLKNGVTMYQYSWSTYLYDLNIESFISLDFQNFKAHIPQIKDYFQAPGKKLFIKISKGISDVKIKNSDILIQIKDTPFKADIPHLLYNILRGLWINKAIFPVHSIAFDNNLIIGHSGTGKTTLAQALIKHGFNLSSFDKTLVKFKNNQILGVSGTHYLSVRLKAQKRIILSPVDIGKFSNYENIFFLVGSMGKLKIEKINSPSSLHQLYPYFLDIQKSITVLEEGNNFYEPKISNVIKKKLCVEISQLKDTNVFSLIGSTTDMALYFKEHKK